jgi:chromosome segregation ATPase
MPDRAKVTSLEAIEAFRAKLVLYRDRAGRVLDEVTEDVVRTRVWLQTDRQAFWQGQIRRLARELEQRQQELFSAQLSDLRDAPRLEQAAVQKAQRALQEAEERLRVVRQWNRQFDQRVDPLARQVEKLRHHLGHDVSLALAWLSDVISTLSAYAELSPTPSSAPPAAPTREAPPAPTEGDAPS